MAIARALVRHSNKKILLLDEVCLPRVSFNVYIWLTLSGSLATKTMLFLSCIVQATSALDHESEQVVQEAIDRMIHLEASPKTTLMVAHKLDTIRNCHVIFVMKHGQVVEQGTHEELMELGRLYERMVTKQNGPTKATPVAKILNTPPAYLQETAL